MSTAERRRAHAGHGLDHWLQDIRYALRTLRGTPGFTAVAITILALGIGANTAIFSLVSAMMLRPLPFEAPERLVMIWENAAAVGGPSRFEPSLADAADWRERSHSFDGLAIYATMTYNLTGTGEPERLVGQRSTWNLFSILGLQPVLGRTFAADDEGPDAEPVAVISTTLWQRRFGADPALIGHTITLDGLERTVIGIVPPYFRFPSEETSVWLPAAFTPTELAERGNYIFYMLGRLKADVSLGAAQAEMAAITSQMRRDTGAGDNATTVTVSGLREHLIRGSRPTLYVLLAAVATLLLITCANVANLLLARGAQRRRELAVRKALGARTGRMVRQLLTESAVLAIAGVVVGIALSTLSFRYLGRLVPGALHDAMQLGLDWRVLTFTTLLAIVTVLLFGAGPALLAARWDFGVVLRSASAATTTGSRGLRNGLVVAEIAFTVVLLAAAGLLLRSYAAVLAVDPGFPTDHLLVAETVLSPTTYSDQTARANFYGRVLERVRTLPGVTAAGYTNAAPLLFKGGRAYITLEGRPAPRPADSQKQIVSDRVVTPGYFETLRVPLLRGRLLGARDDAKAPLVALINERMVRQLYPDEDPIGRRFRFGPEGVDAPWITIVGVVGSVRQMGLDVSAEAEFYLSSDQVPVTFAFFWPKYLVVRTQGDPLAVAPAVRQAVWDIDAAQPVSSARKMSDVLEGDVAGRDTQLTLLGVFSALALLLSAVGLYGVLAYAVTQRTAEIALRMALGAQAANVVRAVVRGALVLVAIGLGLGLVGAFAGMRALTSFLYGVGPSDPITLAAVAGVVVLVALAASYLPARRAAQVDPATVLRGD